MKYLFILALTVLFIVSVDTIPSYADDGESQPPRCRSYAFWCHWVVDRCKSNINACRANYDKLLPIWQSAEEKFADVKGGVGDVLGGLVEIGRAILSAVEYLLMNSSSIMDWITYGIRWIGDVLRDVWRLIKELVSSIVELLQLVFSLLRGIISAWNNATPLPPPGLEDCSTNPTTKTICVVLWAMQETVFYGERGIVIKYLMSNIVAIVLGSLITFKVREILITTNRATS
jgi:hypothetical protein